MTATPADAAASAPRTLRAAGPLWWREWDAGSIESACDACEPGPEVAYWRALASLMRERSDALEHLEQAHAGRMAAGDAEGAGVIAHAALVICLLDTGAMERVRDWLARAHGSAAAQPPEGLDGLWLRLGSLARVALGASAEARADDRAELAAAWLHARLRAQVRESLSPDERLIAAQVLLDYHFARQRYEQVDFLANTVEDPVRFDAASPLMRARWLYARGYAQYQLCAADRAQTAWQQALAIAGAAGLDSLRLQLSLALARLLIDRGRADEASRVVEAVQPRWGGGRTAQLIELQQLRARVHLLRGDAPNAKSTLDGALRLADAAGWSATERASCHTDLAQVLIALDSPSQACDLLARLAAEHAGRDAQVYGCLLALLRAWRARDHDPPGAREALAHGLALAAEARYTMFFRLLPGLAAGLCAQALRASIQAPFVTGVIRARALPAPENADSAWPWTLWIRLLGGFEMRIDGAPPATGGKTQHKPLELLRLLACEPSLAIAMPLAARALWPEARDDAGARKSLEMTIQRLRRLLGDATLLWVHDGRVGLDAARASSDVRQRRVHIDRVQTLAMRAAGQADPAAANAARDECLARVEQVMALSRGDLLPGAPEAAWLAAERQRCRHDTVRLALAAAATMQRAQASDAECELLEAALRIEPLAESLVRRLMLAFERAGRRGDALRVFETFRARIAEHGAAPGAPTDRLWRELTASPGAG